MYKREIQRHTYERSICAYTRGLTRDVQEVYKRRTRGIPEVYKRCTRGVQEVYQRCTRGAQEAYQRCKRGVQEAVYKRQCTRGIHTRDVQSSIQNYM